MNTMGKVSLLNRHKIKNKKFDLVDKLYLKKDYGILESVYGGKRNRQVSMFSKENRQKLQKEKIKGLCTERFQEDITTEGVDLKRIKKDTKIQIGEVILKVSEIGKRCFDNCLIEKKEKCLLKNQVIFLEVINSGWISVNDEIKVYCKGE